MFGGAGVAAAAASSAARGSFAAQSGLEAPAAVDGPLGSFGAPPAPDPWSPPDAGTEDLSGLDDDVVLAFLSARRAG
jgi:hypothetical protein